MASPGLIELRRGAGAYICGEESAMIESIEGKRGLPRHRPPYVAQVGLFGRPTLVNNVETLFWVRDIVEKGADWFAAPGPQRRQGAALLFGLRPGHGPGVKLAPAGITARELIDEFCGGMAPGPPLPRLPARRRLGRHPAGVDGRPAARFRQARASGLLRRQPRGGHSVRPGRPQGAVRNLMRFFEDESCGQCTPCRVGTEKAVRLMERPVWDTALLDELARR